MTDPLVLGTVAALLALLLGGHWIVRRHTGAGRRRARAPTMGHVPVGLDAWRSARSRPRGSDRRPACGRDCRPHLAPQPARRACRPGSAVRTCACSVGRGSCRPGRQRWRPPHSSRTRRQPAHGGAGFGSPGAGASEGTCGARAGSWPERRSVSRPAPPWPVPIPAVALPLPWSQSLLLRPRIHLLLRPLPRRSVPQPGPARPRHRPDRRRPRCHASGSPQTVPNRGARHGLRPGPAADWHRA